MNKTLGEPDRLEILDLYARYAHAYDGGRAQEYGELFVEDGQFEREGADPVRGRPALIEMARNAFERSKGFMHITSNITLTADGDGARGTAYVVLLRVDPEAVAVAAIGRYEDVLARTEQGWAFNVRRFRPSPAPPLPAVLASAAASPSRG